MAKLVLLLCIAFLAISMAIAQVPNCRPPGFICSTDTDCCAPFVCNPWANRCTGGPGVGSAKNAA